MFRRHARTVGLAGAALYIVFGICFVVWYLLIRT